MIQSNFKRVCFYIVAHADDWQLFMCPDAYNNVKANDIKVVFIITTAGDAGKDKKFWMAREEGAKSSLRFCLAPLKKFSESGGLKKFNNHLIHYWYAANTTSYFLRLPDGNLNGKGFPLNNYQSLTKLKCNEIHSITAVDNATTYNSWTDFFTTLQTIILAESGSIGEQRINYINPDITANPNDHADHIATGNAIQCMNIPGTMQEILFTGYSLNNQGNPINNSDLFWKAGIFAAYCNTVFNNSGYSTLKEDADAYLKWCCSNTNCITV